MVVYFIIRRNLLYILRVQSGDDPLWFGVHFDKATSYNIFQCSKYIWTSTDKTTLENHFILFLFISFNKPILNNLVFYFCSRNARLNSSPREKYSHFIINDERICIPNKESLTSKQGIQNLVVHVVFMVIYDGSGKKRKCFVF